MNPPPPPPPETNEGSSYVPYPKLDPNDVVPVVDTWTHTTTTTIPPSESVNNNPYVISSPLSPPQNNNNNKKETMKDVVGRWGKKAAEVSKKAEGLAGDMWQHLKTGPSLTDAVVGRITQGTKVLAEGGYEKLFQQTFETLPDEKLLRSCGCYLSTSAGPIVGTLYLSTLKLAFSSDNPISHKVSEVEEVQSAYYKVVILVHQLKAVNPITSKSNPAEKYIQIISADNHEFWFMGFLNYDSAVKYLQDAMQPRPM